MINKEFQFRFMLFVCSVSLIGILIQVLTTLYMLTSIINADENQRFSQYLYNYLKAHSGSYLSAVAIGAGSFLLISLLASLFFSHKIAGPLYRLHLFLTQNSKTADKTTKLSFRKGDFFQEIPRDFNQFAEAKDLLQDTPPPPPQDIRPNIS